MLLRLGIDVGTNSLGWSVLKLELMNGVATPVDLIACGSRIFSNGRTPAGDSNAADRREHRGARKNRDRAKRRQQRLIRQLLEYGLFPEDEVQRKALEGGKGMPLEDSDPWILRYRGLHERIDLHQLGRAIFHLHQRRGFKSNRKVDKADDEKGPMKAAMKQTLESLKEAGATTLGELFGKPRMEVLTYNKTVAKKHRKPQPLARVRKSGSGKTLQYDYYPTRDLILNEFDRLWEAQKGFHGGVLTDQAWHDLRDTIEWQHDLKPTIVGKCMLLPAENRAPKALPSFQRSRIFQEVNNLRIAPVGAAKTALDLRQRNLIAGRLLTPTSKTGKVTFGQLRKLKDIGISEPFSIETKKRKDLDGDITAARLMQKNLWGPEWLDLDLNTQDDVVMRLLNDEDENVLVDWLMSEHGLDRDQAFRVADCSLTAGYGNLSKVALDLILPPLEANVTVYSDAVEQSGLGSHSQFGDGEVFDKALPYYGVILERAIGTGTGEPKDPDEIRYGKVSNPTVHVALNQIRVLVNELMRRFGTPHEIVIEVARDLPLSAKGKKDLEKYQAKNQTVNENLSKRLANDFVPPIPDNYQNRLRLRLYTELEPLDWRCVYSGEQISITDLFTDKVEIEHILPFSQTYDDSTANKTLSLRKANRDKGSKSPYEAFGSSPAGYDWDAIVQRAAELPDSKKWRFAPDAMERFDSDGGFLERQLNDTRYISKMALGYLSAIYGGQGLEGQINQVWAVTGRLTSDLRWNWGLDSVLRGHNESGAEQKKKNRDDHRHHAIDAVVIACTDRSMLQAAAREAKKNEAKHDGRLLAGISEPWVGFREDVAAKVRGAVVSHKPDHGFQSAMHDKTAYGIAKGPAGEPDKSGKRTVITRKPLDGLAFKSPKDLAKIRDPKIRSELQKATEGLEKKEFHTALVAAGAAMTPPVYRVRVETNLNVRPFKDRAGKNYKAVKTNGNYCYDIWMGEDGNWESEIISTFDAYQLARENQDWWRGHVGRDGQPLLMRLRKGDYLQVEHEGDVKKMQIQALSEGDMSLAEHFEANTSARTKDAESTFKYLRASPKKLQRLNARYMTVSPSGLVKI